MAVSDLLDKLNPPRSFSLKLKYPEEKKITFTRNRQGDISISDEEAQLFRLKEIKLYLTADDKKRISEGAIAGAAVAAARGGDVLKGAIIGDWWQKQKDDKARKVEISLLNQDSGAIRTIRARLKRKQYERVKNFFKA